MENLGSEKRTVAPAWMDVVNRHRREARRDPIGAKPPEEMGLLATLGDIIDRPDNALRGAFIGRWDALRGLVPFGETLGVFGDENRVSGTDVNKYFFGIEHDENDGLLSGSGMAGLGTEMALSVYNVLPGLGALTKSGKAAKLVGGGLKAADRGMDALRAGKLAWNTLPEAALAGARQVGPAVALDSPLAKAGKYLTEKGAPLELLDDWKAAAEAGQRNLVTLGGEFAPVPFAKPLAELPEVALLRAPGAVGGLQKLGQGVKALPGIKQAAKLFELGEPGLKGGGDSKALAEELEEARKIESAGVELAGEQADLVDAAIGGMGPWGDDVAEAGAARLPGLSAAKRAGGATGGLPVELIGRGAENVGGVRVGGEIVDPNTGEIIEAAGELTPELKKIEAQLEEKMRKRDWLDEKYGRMELDPASKEFQVYQHARQKLNREIIHLDAWLEAGRKPDIGAHAKAREIEAHRAVDLAAETGRDVGAVEQYLERAGYGTKEAAEAAVKMVGKEVDREKVRQIANYIERGDDATEEVKELGDAIVKELEKIYDAEQAFVVPTARLQDPRVSYLTRVGTRYGTKWFSNLDMQQRAEIFKALEEARLEKGMAVDPTRWNRPLREGPPEAIRREIPPQLRGAAKQARDDLAPETEAWLRNQGLMAEFNAFDAVLANTHGSQIQRLRAFEGLSITELNEVFARAGGARAEVFNEHPAAALFARKARHARAKAADQFFRSTAARLGKEIDGASRRQPLTKVTEETVRGMEPATMKEMPAARRRGNLEPVPIEDAQGFEEIVDIKTGEVKGYGISAFNDQLEALGVQPVMFETMDAAKAVERTARKLATPEEVTPLLDWIDKTARQVAQAGAESIMGQPEVKAAVGALKDWRDSTGPLGLQAVLGHWDRGTSAMKSYVTRPFAAFHVRNRISNRIQSWLEDVPVIGEHYKAANRVVAGADAKLTLGDGTVLGRDEIVKELRQQGLWEGGFWEKEVGGGKRGARLEGRGGLNLDVMDPENVMISAPEKVSSGIAVMPGQFVSGVGKKSLGKIDSSMVENIDRFGHYLYKRRQGYSPADAALSVKRSLFDYSELSSFEKEVLNRVFFFYQYQRKVMPLVLSSLWEAPNKVKKIMQVGGGAGGKREGMPAKTPQWMREGLPVPIGTDAAGNALVIYGFGTPVEGALEPVTGFWESGARGAEVLASRLNPALRIPAELATGRSFFLGRGIEHADKAPNWVGRLPESVQGSLGVKAKRNRKGQVKRWEADPYALYMLGASPWGRYSSTASKGLDPRKDLDKRLLNILSGMKIVSVDPETGR